MVCRFPRFVALGQKLLKLRHSHLFGCMGAQPDDCENPDQQQEPHLLVTSLQPIREPSLQAPDCEELDTNYQAPILAQIQRRIVFESSPKLPLALRGVTLSTAFG